MNLVDTVLDVPGGRGTGGRLSSGFCLMTAFGTWRSRHHAYDNVETADPSSRS